MSESALGQAACAWSGSGHVGQELAWLGECAGVDRSVCIHECVCVERCAGLSGSVREWAAGAGMGGGAGQAGSGQCREPGDRSVAL